MSEQRFYEGDVIVIRENEYTVGEPDAGPNGEILHYPLIPRREGVEAQLKVGSPRRDGYRLVEYRNVDDDEITVIE